MAGSAVLKTREIVILPVDKIRTNPYQPRKFFDRSALEELADSIREYGVLQPVSVRLINGCSYELVAGERRLRASKLAGLGTIPAIVVNISDHDSAMLAMIENLQRQNLHFIEEAEGFQNLLTDYAFTQEVLARRVGKSQSTIANKIRILQLSKEARRLVVENGLTERHARALLKLADEEAQCEIIRRVGREALTVKQTEDLVEKTLLQKKAVERKVKPITQIRDVRIMTNTVEQAVGIMQKAGLRASYHFDRTLDGYDALIHIEV